MTVADEAVGKRVRCSKCKNVFRIEVPAQAQAVAVQQKKARRNKKKKPRVYVEVHYPAWLGILSCAWALVGWALASLAPHLAFVPLVGVLHYALPAVTVALIGANLYLAVRNLWRGAHPLALLLVTGLQMGLFTTLFFQLFAHLGAALYDVQGPTSAWQWLGFSLAHALRAWDVLDVIEAYSLNVQMIRHDGWLVACFVILYHVVVDVFFLGVVWDVVERIKEHFLEDEGIRDLVRKALIAAVALWFVAWMVIAHRWALIDHPLWFAENILRVLDFADIMESFDLSLHGLPREGLTGTLTFFCRLWIAIGIGLVLSRKKQAAERRVGTPPGAGALAYWSARAGILAAGLLVVLGTGLLWQVVLADPLPGLAGAAGGQSEGRATAALAALRRMGPTAQAAVPALTVARQTAPEKTRDDITRTLGYLGTEAVDPLADIALGEGEASAGIALKSLGRIRPDAAPALVKVWSATPSEAVRKQAAAELQRFGKGAVPPLMAATTPENAEAHYHWFVELDRNWTMRSTPNKVAKALQKLPEMLQELKKGPKDATTVKILDGLRDCGSAARTALPPAIDRLGARDSTVQAAAEALVVSIGPAATPELLRRLDFNAPKLDGPLLRILTGEGMWNEAVLKDPMAIPTLTKMVNHQGTPIELRMTAVHVLALAGPSAREAVPGLLSLLTANLPQNRALVREALGKIDPEWKNRPNTRRAIIGLFPRLAGLPAGESEELLAILGDLQESDGDHLAQVLLAKEEQNYRDTVFGVLDRLGPKARGAASALASALTDSKVPLQTRLRLLESLKKITSLTKIASEVGALVPSVMAYRRPLGPNGESIAFLKENFPATRDYLGKMLEDKDPDAINQFTAPHRWRLCAVQVVYALQAANLLRDEDKTLYLPKVIALLLDREEDITVDKPTWEALERVHPHTYGPPGQEAGARPGAGTSPLAKDLPKGVRVPEFGAAPVWVVSSWELVLETLNALDRNWAQNEAVRTVLPALAATIGSGSSKERGGRYLPWRTKYYYQRVLQILCDAGPAARPLVPDLVKLLLTQQHIPFFEDLRKAVDRIDPDWRKLPVVQESIPELMERLAHEKENGSGQALLILLGEAAVPALEKALALEAVKVANAPGYRARILDILKATGAANKEVVTAVLKQVVNPKLTWQQTAHLMASLNATDPKWASQPKAKEMIPGVLAEVAGQRGSAARYAVICGAIGPGAVPEVLKLLEGEKAEQRGLGLVALGQIGPGARETLPAITKALKDKDGKVRQAAVNAVSKVGKGDRDLIPVLGPYLVDDDPSVQSATLGAMKGLDPDWKKAPQFKEALAPVLKNFSNSDPKGRARSLWVLEQIGPADGVVPALEELVKGEKDPGNLRRAQGLLDKNRRAPK